MVWLAQNIPGWFKTTWIWISYLIRTIQLCRQSGRGTMPVRFVHSCRIPAIFFQFMILVRGHHAFSSVFFHFNNGSFFCTLRLLISTCGFDKFLGMTCESSGVFLAVSGDRLKWIFKKEVQCFKLIPSIRIRLKYFFINLVSLYIIVLKNQDWNITRILYFTK